MEYIKGISVYLPNDVVTNEQITAQFPEWSGQKILDKIGVQQRYIAQKNEFTSDMATQAIRKLLEEYQIDKKDIDYLIVCTQTPDYQLPTTACLVQQMVGFPTSCGALDINQGCSGYIYGLSLAKGLVASGNFKNILLVTADVYSKLIHPKDKGNISIFGDAATATLISTSGQYRIGNFTMGTDGTGAENLIVRNSAMRYSKTKDTNDMNNFLQMKGGEIFKFVIKYVPSMLFDNMKVNDQNINTIDLFVFHQANTFILEKLRQEMKIPVEKYVLEMLNCGNTVSSSVPIAMKSHSDKYPHKKADILQIAGFGVGYSWGAVCLFKE